MLELERARMRELRYNNLDMEKETNTVKLFGIFVFEDSQHLNFKEGSEFLSGVIGSRGWSAAYFMQTTEDVVKAVAAVATAAAALRSPRPSAVFSIKDDNSQFQKFQRQFSRVLKGSSPPSFKVKKAAYNPKVLTSLKRQWARFQLHAMGHRSVKDPSRLFESMVVLGLHPNTDIRALEQQILGRRYVDEYETVESDAVAIAVNGVTEVSTVEVEVVEAPVHSGQDEVLPVTEPASTVPEDTPKKSYASIVKVMKETTPVHVPTNIRKVAAGAGKVAAKVVGGIAEQGTASPAPASVAPAPSSNNGPNSSNLPEEVEGYSIYVKSLPLNASVSEVEEEFKTFGKIRPNGIQVRSTNKQGGGFCFGFVEFESLESVKSALKASPITFGDRQVYIEEKRTSTRVGATGKPRYPPARPGFRNDNFRGRGNFVGGRGYGRNEYGNRGDFSGRRSQSGRGGDGYQRVEHNVGNGKVGRQGGMTQTAVSA